ncbi:MAG TPA: HAD-IA family hydrolase, partial [Chthoniobacterales bacterium]
GGAVVKMLGLIRGRAISGEDMAALKQAVASMPPHPEVAAALQKLKEAGFRMVTLTNNPEKTVIEQLKQAELSRFFERSFSIDDHVRRYKPAPESYGAVATALGVQLSQCCMVACHAWDILGAAAVGMETALLLRPGNAVISVGPQPTITGSDLGVVADALIACHVH